MATRPSLDVNSDSEADAADFNPGGDVDFDCETLSPDGLELDEVEAPVDGYFQQRNHPQHTFVQQSFVQAESEVKAREAAAERAASTATAAEDSTAAAGPSRLQQPGIVQASWARPHSCIEPSWAQPETTPHGDPEPPPPDYQTAMSETSSPQSPNGSALPLQQQATLSGVDYGTIGSGHERYAHPEDSTNGQCWRFEPAGNPLTNPNFPFTAQTGLPGASAAFSRDHPLVRNGIFGEHGTIHNRRQPEIMRDSRTPAPPLSLSHSGDPAGPADEETGLLLASRGANRDNQPGRSSRPDPRKWRSVFTACSAFNLWLKILVVVCIVAVVAYAAISVRDAIRTNDGLQDGSDGGDSPADGSPADGGDDGNDGNDETWPEPPVSRPSIPFPPHTRGCSWRHFSKEESFHFTNLTDFSFIESLTYDHYGPAHISGSVLITPAPADQKSEVVVSVLMQTTEDWKIQNLIWSKSEDGMELEYPDIERIRKGSKRGCLWIGVLISVRPGFKIGNWKTKTLSCDIRAATGLFTAQKEIDSSKEEGLIITHRTTFSTVSGEVDVLYWGSSRTVIKTVSGGVTGSLALLDSLNIRTTSGMIDVDVNPKSAGKKTSEHRADLEVSSTSGNVNIELPINGKDIDIPDRDYRTRVDTTSGRLGGLYILGSSAVFTSVSGSINATVLPYSPAVKSLKTDSTSGNTYLTVLPPYASSRSSSRKFFDSSSLNNSDRHPSSSSYHLSSPDAITRLRSSHDSVSGNVRLEYPSQWEGTINVDTSWGEIDVVVDDVGEDTKFRGEKWKHSYVGRRGTGDGRLSADTKTGNIRVLFSRA